MKEGIRSATLPRLRLPDLPVVIWLLLLTLAIGVSSNLTVDELLALFGDGWGRSLGDFAAVLLPSFVLAAAMAGHTPSGASLSAAAAGPFAAAGMVCPDTGYAALSPLAGRRRIALGLGNYAGFKLLFPAGPLLVATGVGMASNRVFLLAALVFVPVWIAGLLWARQFQLVETRDAATGASTGPALVATLAPLLVLAALIIVGFSLDVGRWPILDLATRPPGALLLAALLALFASPRHARRQYLDQGIRRTGSLLFLIGAASALGTVLMAVTPLSAAFRAADGVIGLLSIVTLTAAVKLIQGSSLATFASVTPVVAPIAAGGGISAEATVLGVCVGSIVAVLPNDSFYWLVRDDALAGLSEKESVLALAGGTFLQGLVALVCLLLMYSLGLV